MNHLKEHVSPRTVHTIASIPKDKLETQGTLAKVLLVLPRLQRRSLGVETLYEPKPGQRHNLAWTAPTATDPRVVLLALEPGYVALEPGSSQDAVTWILAKPGDVILLGSDEVMHYTLQVGKRVLVYYLG